LIDFGDIRAKFLEFGVDPRAAGEMSLYEIFSMFAKLAKKDAVMSDKDFDAAKDWIRGLNLPDVRI
jgi:hypothetical protein